MHQEKNITATAESNYTDSYWNAVFAVALAVAGLITSEFLPVSLLTPMAEDLQISEGAAGQAISITAAIAMLSSLLISSITKTLDRRRVLLILCVLQITSNLLVFCAPNFSVLLTGRVLLGIGLGGFWGMLAATAMRLVAEKEVQKALSIIYIAVSLATVIAAPMGSFLGNLFGWRNVFLIAAALGFIAFILQAITLPKMPVDKITPLKTVIKVLQLPSVKSGMFATLFSFMAYAVLFTYLRPFLEQITGVGSNILSLILLGFGLTNLIGATVARHLLLWDLYRSLALMPLLMGISAVGLVLFGNISIVAALLIGLWGMALGVVQLGWTAWLTKTIPDEAESAGGIQIAVIQLAIMTGAASGGWVFDNLGAKGVFIFSSVVAFIAASVVFQSSLRIKKLKKQKKPGSTL
ncbi:MFS transporter [Flavobacterium johnsoniae]|uniref:Major facilitator superfamily MFS_1 n=1 Tax=Flavobacterium johnsoniae (strain ATCC 17061 / DSM 2064 / JCM 8514 / BCRC 14874 / CCUG 350202 / NBRC 14942 / NCIMB 11054 / UW101) TaxID=376686 RepID=A5FFA6_FLAJ1|nr:MFS transporter [Flavobacterium johnsoniae]ABQ06114.1 major facilitator superfamily MFS_1 [Flavobacterium johnsoniae UW101]OXE98406.1 MFS transporter [Flavobacterium johnsoniae UW101]WQG81860.1 MFS transporter [Flavobacterium johnsoniae UW101]SHK66275.1 MFS transporter, DHA1 family, purine ribonucleoside efflux pump [Flavobacterium johnsoniae]